MTTYLGQSYPIIAPLVGRYFGRKGATVNRYGTNLAAAALQRQEHSMLHNQLQLLLQDIMKVGGILLEKEAANFLLGKVGDPHATSYVDHVARKNKGNRRAKHTIVPDIHAINFPAGK